MAKSKKNMIPYVVEERKKRSEDFKVKNWYSDTVRVARDFGINKRFKKKKK